MAKRRSARSGGPTLLPEAAPLRFDEKLVLNQWMLWLFDKRSFDQLAEPLKVAELEGLDDDNTHKFLHQLKLLWDLEELPGDTLLGYDQNIVKHTLRLNERRAVPIRWKYFQWLSLLFAEIYLDRCFRDSGKLLADLNAFLERWNEDKSEQRSAAPLRAGRPAEAGLLERDRQRQDAAHARQHPPIPALPPPAWRERELNRIILLDAQRGSVEAAPGRVPRGGHGRRPVLQGLPGRSLPARPSRSSTSTSCARRWATRPSPSTRSRGTTSCWWTKAIAGPAGPRSAAG